MKEKDITSKKGVQAKIFKFDASFKAPSNKINARNGLVEWGDKNLFPNEMIKIYNWNGAPAHKAIINKKTKLITGTGFSNVTDPALKAFLKKNKFNKEVKKIALDYELLNGFAIELIWDRIGENITSIKHIPIHKVRQGVENDDYDYPYYWYSNDWAQYRKAEYEPKAIRAFDPDIREGKQLYVHYEYNPESEVYPIVGYSTTLNWIELHHEISKFHINQVKQGYTPSFILNFATGIPTEDEQDEFFKAFKKDFSGPENSGKIVITYSNGKEEAPELTAVELNDSDDRFVMLMEQIENNIVIGAEIPPQIMILTAGKLGSTEERKELLEEFQASYITPRQEVIEEAVNEILQLAGFTETVTLKEYDNNDNN